MKPFARFFLQALLALGANCAITIDFGLSSTFSDVNLTSGESLIFEWADEAPHCVQWMSCPEGCPMGKPESGPISGEGFSVTYEFSEFPVGGRYTYQCCIHGLAMTASVDVEEPAVNECENGSHNCHHLAECMDTPEAFTCTCPPRYYGNGTNHEEGCVKGDPHFTGFNGGKYDFPGDVGTVYNIISDENFQLNSRFIEPIHNETQCKGNETALFTAPFYECESNCFHDPQCAAYSWSGTSSECKKFDDYHGEKYAENMLCGVFDVPASHSFMGDFGILMGTHNMTIHVGIDAPSVVFLDGNLVSEDISLPDIPATLKFERLKTRRRAPQIARYMLSLTKYKIEIIQKKYHFNIEVEYIPSGPPLPHGALGQSARWEKACFGESKRSNSCIEGDYQDYEIQSGDLLGTDFRWNQYVVG